MGQCTTDERTVGEIVPLARRKSGGHGKIDGEYEYVDMKMELFLNVYIGKHTRNRTITASKGFSTRYPEARKMPTNILNRNWRIFAEIFSY